jgi:hypothetical protein
MYPLTESEIAAFSGRLHPRTACQTCRPVRPATTNIQSRLDRKWFVSLGSGLAAMGTSAGIGSGYLLLKPATMSTPSSIGGSMGKATAKKPPWWEKGK